MSRTIVTRSTHVSAAAEFQETLYSPEPPPRTRRTQSISQKYALPASSHQKAHNIADQLHRDQVDLEKEDSEAYKSNQAGSKSAVDEFIERERQKAESGPKLKGNNPIDPPEVKEASTANSSKKPDCKTTDQCPICCFNVDTGEEGVYCDECRTWNHRICLKLDQQEYIQLSKSDELFKCPTCDDRFITSLPDFQCNDGLCQAKFGELAGEEIREEGKLLTTLMTKWFNGTPTSSKFPLVKQAEISLMRW